MIAGSVFRTTAEVGPGHRIEIVVPEFVEGGQVEVTVRPTGSEPAQTVFEALRILDIPMRDAAYWEERERELKESRDSWER
ncbi:hypothetical protein BH11ARM2_BH11ARM2_27760 [soil metagenome]